MLALSSAEALESERDALGRQIIGEKEVINEVKAEINLIINHAAGGARSHIAQLLGEHQTALEMRLLGELREEFPRWATSLHCALASFEAWLSRALARELVKVSDEERARLTAPLGRVSRQVFRALQSFRDRLSERTMRAYGVPLRTTEVEIRLEEPKCPDIRIGKVFDRNWELLSPVVPMWLMAGLVARHFAGKVPYMVEKNLSRLASQWAESLCAAMRQIGREAERRLDELVGTVARLVTSGRNDAPLIREDLARINFVLDEVRRAAGSRSPLADPPEIKQCAAIAEDQKSGRTA
jgi:hypothetical protein